MAKIEKFEQLIAWQKAMLLAERVHAATAGFPKTEMFGIGLQLRRAAVSVPSNLAEGFQRHSRASYRSHVAIAAGSLAEVQTLIELCRRVELIAGSIAAELLVLAVELGRVVHGLWRSLTISAVCYSVVIVAAMLFGLWPSAFGLLP